MAMYEPPVTPPGWSIGPPDFVGVGAQRSGTTWWFGVITTHPQICHKRGFHVKEVHFFDDLGDLAELNGATAEHYHRFFPRPPETLIGEWTPRYMFDPWTPRQLARAAPAARLMMMLRDPIDRYVSGMARELNVERRRGGTELDAETIEGQVARGFYAEQVRRVLDAFPREQVLILQYEKCRAQQKTELRRTCEFLGLDADLVPSMHARPKEPNERSLPPEERDRLAEAYAPDAVKLAEIAPEIDVGLWQSLRGVT
jgi:sulfotransferase family protein